MGILDDAIREHLELKRRHGADSQEVSRQEREILGADGEPGAAEAAAPTYDDGSAPEDGFLAEIEDVPAAPALPAEPLAGSPLADPEPVAPPVDDLFPGTGELMQAAAETPAAPPAPAPAAPSPSLAAPAPSGADSETAARSGARRLSDDELAAWRRRLSERADRLAAQRPGTEAPAPATPAGEAATPAAKSEPPAYWSGNTAGADAGAPPKLTKPETASHAAVPPVEAEQPGVPVDFFDAGDAEGAFAPEKAPEPVAEDHDVLDETPDFLEETPEHDRMWFEQRPPRDFDFG
jgi:hypothetical protein